MIRKPKGQELVHINIIAIRPAHNALVHFETYYLMSWCNYIYHLTELLCRYIICLCTTADV